MSVDFSNGEISGDEGTSVELCITVSSSLISFENSLVVTTQLLDSDIASMYINTSRGVLSS